MLALALVLIFTSCCLLLLGSYRLLFYDRHLVAERLALLQGGKKRTRRLREELQEPLLTRIGKPLWVKLAGVFARRMSGAKQLQFRRRLEAAGNPAGLEPGGFRLLQVLLALSLGGVGAVWGILCCSTGREFLLLVIAGFVCGALLPELYITLQIKKRRQEVMRSLPDALDLLTVSVEAGLGFDLALLKVTERFSGVLGEELNRLLQEMKLGKPRRDALRGMAARVGDDDLTNFVTSLVQAEQLGVSIGNILRLQSREIRRKRRQRAEEQAMQAPVKMLFPLVFFIFPALFVVLLGPALIQIMRQL